MKQTALWGTLVVSVGVALLLPRFATADMRSDALSEFGLLGVWAEDCSKLPTRANPHVTYAARNGVFTRALSFDGSYVITEMRNLRITAPDRLVYDLYEGGQNAPTDYMIVVKIGEGVRAHQRVRADGTPLIKDSKFVASNLPTPIYRRCSVELSANEALQPLRQGEWSGPGA